MASDVDIVNQSITQLGGLRITSLSDDTETARKANAIYSVKLDELLAMHKWNFAMKRANLGKLTTTPEYEFDNEYQLPSDYIRLCSINGEDVERIEHAIEGGKLLLNEDTAKIKYISRVTDEGLFPSFFITAFSGFLAFELAYSLTQSASMSERMWTVFKDKLKLAKSLDGQSGGAQQKPRQDDILLVRGRDEFNQLKIGIH